MTSETRVALRLASVMAITVSTLGCTPMMRDTTGGIVPGYSIAPGAKILVLSVPDGIEKEDGPAGGSGNAVYSAMRDQLISRGFLISPSDATSLSEAFDEAKALGCHYILRGRIPEWEDNATEWSGKPDVAAFSAELFDAESHVLAASGSHRVQSSSGQGFSRRPERFVPELVDHALGRIFGWRPSAVAPK